MKKFNVMKKLLPILALAAMLCAVASCGDDKDEPVVPDPQTLESVYQDATETHYTFDIDMDRDSSSIYLYNIVFRIGDAVSPAMNIRIDAPVNVDKTGKIFTFAGTGIAPYLLRGTTPVPMSGDAYLVHNLTCTVNTGNKTFNIAFDCHGGHHSDSGNLK